MELFNNPTKSSVDFSLIKKKTLYIMTIIALVRCIVISTNDIITMLIFIEVINSNIILITILGTSQTRWCFYGDRMRYFVCETV